MSSAVARPDDEAVVVIKAGHVLSASGEDIAGGEIVIIDGKIRLVGTRLEYPKSAKVINAPTETIIPGLIDARTRPDLPNYSRTGVHGDLKAAADVYVSQIDFEPYLRAGFTSIAIYPAGTGVPGVASVYHTAGPDAERLMSVPGYVRMTMNSQPRDKGTLRDALKKAKAEIDKVEKARQEWETKKKEFEAKKKAEAEKPPGEKPAGDAPKEPPKEPAPPPGPQPQGPPAPKPPAPDAKKPDAPAATPGDPGEFKPPEMDPAHRPFIDLLQKKAGAPLVMLELGRASDFTHAADVLQDHKDLKWIWQLGSFPGAADFNYVVSHLGDLKALVVMAPMMHRQPQSLVRYNLAGELVSAGCEVAYIPTGETSLDLDTFRAKAADLSRAGVERADAIKAITLNPARVIGAGAQLGSIEKGKSADLVFLSGDILDPLSKVTRVMINGEIVWKAEEGKR